MDNEDRKSIPEQLRILADEIERAPAPTGIVTFSYVMNRIVDTISNYPLDETTPERAIIDFRYGLMYVERALWADVIDETLAQLDNEDEEVADWQSEETDWQPEEDMYYEEEYTLQEDKPLSEQDLLAIFGDDTSNVLLEGIPPASDSNTKKR